MQRRDFVRQCGVMAAAGFVFRNSALGQLVSTYDYKITMLRNHVGIFTERGGTIGFLAAKEGNIVIDSQFPDTAAHLIDDLKQRASGSFLYLLNTHHHGDHTGGNIAFRGIADHVLAHVNSLANQKAVAEKSNSVDKQLFPDQTFDDSVKLKIGDEKIEGYYFGAGHTNGDAVYHFQNANIMHVGDLMFNKRHPFVDRSAGANMKSWVTVLDKIIKKGNKDTLYIFGHSLTPGEETGSAEDLKKFQDYLTKVVRFAEDEYNKGVTKQDFIKNTAIPGVTAWSGQGIERPLTAAYEEVEAAHVQKQ